MNLEEPVGRIRRPSPGGGRKRDRRLGLIYRPVGRPPSARVGKAWSSGQYWALQHDACIGEVLRDTASVPLLERQGLIRLAQLTYSSFALPGPVIIEAPAGLDPLTKAVVASYVVGAGREMRIGSFSGTVRSVTARIQRNWLEDAGAARVAAAVDCLTRVANKRMLESGSLDVVLELGSGELRNVELAQRIAVDRSGAGWSGRHIREYLELYGFQNFSGTVGRWSHDQFARLLGGES